MKIRVLGQDPARCSALHAHTCEALERLGLHADVVDEFDPVKIAMAGVVMTPALDVDGHVIVKGRVPSVDQLVQLLAA